ncbi:MAG TPA: PfkB family carbohydrate kinase [Bacteroidia bacterium]|nr:PfkB family carbohydrate kinase [Bacteroidia bacterium]HNT79737.1 PfkB family carbohydrate kinase [Bacteroidia bacterium]
MNSASYINDLFDSFNRKRILIIGDVMIDAYYWGKVDRISPEAPVPIVQVEKKEKRPGGAANVALNIHALGAEAILCTAIGDDKEGEIFKQLLKVQGIRSDYCKSFKNKTTTVKTRVIGNKHQLLRVDEEDASDLSKENEVEFVQLIKECINNESIDGIVLEDYNKGNLTKFVIEQIIQLANQKKIPTAVDPKKYNFNAYRNVTLFKPNFHELKTGLNKELSIENANEMEKAIQKFRNEMNIQTLLLTLSEHGIFYQNNAEQKIIPAHIRTISDVSGAGDTVIGVAALCLACQTSDYLMAALSNLAGGLVCEQIGVVPIDKNQLLDEAIKLKIYNPTLAV